MDALDVILDPHQLVYADYFVAVLVTAAMVMQFWRLAWKPKSMMVVVGRWTIGVGWGFLVIRAWVGLYRDGDLPVSALGLVSISLIALGSLLVNCQNTEDD